VLETMPLSTHSAKQDVSCKAESCCFGGITNRYANACNSNLSARSQITPAVSDGALRSARQAATPS
jgi:hypothetical protein